MWLSASEHRRFSRLSAPRRCAQFLTARRLLRELLAAVHGGDPWRDWTLGAADDGPPHVERAPAGAPESLWLAVSHSADQVACAVAPFAIGIDIEVPRTRRNLGALAAAICSADELRQLQSLPQPQWPSHFYALWTLKEAWFKSRREGLDLAALPCLHTEPEPHADPTTCNAWLWRRDALALALVALPQAKPTWVEAVSAARLDTPQRWHVALRAHG